MSSNANKTMNDLLRAHAPTTASTPDNARANDQVNQWHRDSVQVAQEERVVTLWDRLWGAHQRELDWAKRLEDSGNE